MTVISTVITSQYTAHATDSFITVLLPDGTYEPTDKQGTKIVRVPKWRGAMSYFGWATGADGWNTLAWLRGQANAAGRYASAEDFARGMGAALESEIRRRAFSKPTNSGIGIHFTCYEYVQNYWVPELFMISNWETPEYNSLRPGGVGVTRELYASAKGLPDRPDSQRDPAARLELRTRLRDEGQLLWLYNGDPRLFRPYVDVAFMTIREFQRRGILCVDTIEAHAALARRPVEFVSDMLTSFAKKGTRVIGGRPHELVIAPNGTYWSGTGD
jgi:hypothetical protein